MLFAALHGLVLAGLFVRFTVFSGDRIRAIRWRIRLRLHPGPGFASIGDCGSAGPATLRSATAPGPGPACQLRHRLRAHTTDYAVRLGRGQWFRRAYARMEDQVLVMAAQRTGKSGIVADRILDHPGPGARHQHPRGPVREHVRRAGAARPGARVQPAGRRRRPLVAGLGSPRPLQTWSWPAGWLAGSRCPVSAGTCNGSSRKATSR